MVNRKLLNFDEIPAHIEDDDGGTDADYDVCERCGNVRALHKDGTGPCERDDRCQAFVDAC